MFEDLSYEALQWRGKRLLGIGQAPRLGGWRRSVVVLAIHARIASLRGAVAFVCQKEPPDES